MSVFPTVQGMLRLLLLALLNPHFISCTTPIINATRCANATYTNISYRSDLDKLLSTLPSMAAQTGFYNSTVGPLFGLAICLDNTSPSDCLTCLNIAAQNLTTNPRCTYRTSAVSWFHPCMLHYAHSNFVTLPKTVYYYCKIWGDSEPNSGSFTTAVVNLMKERSLSAAYNSEKMLAVGERSYSSATIGNTTIYGLVQCTRDLSSDNCSACLANYTATLLSYNCSRKRTYIGGTIFGESCFFWYDKKPFNTSAALSLPPMPNAPNPSPSQTARDGGS